MLIVGWAPSLLLAYYSYTVLSRTLEAKIMADAHSLARSFSMYVQNELDRTAETLDFYRTLPATANALLPPLAPAVPASGALPAAAKKTARPATAPPPAPPLPAAAAVVPGAQEWLAGILFPQRRIDGLFLADPAGRPIASVPSAADPRAGGTFADLGWRPPEGAAAQGVYCSPVHPRLSDGRPVTSLVVTVQEKGGAVIGYLGADILVERIGKRLQSLGLLTQPGTALRIIDQKGYNVFRPENETLPQASARFDPAAIRNFRINENGSEERNGQLYIYSTLEPSGWLLILEKNGLAAHQPVHDLLRQTLLLAGWLVVGTAITAYLISGFYRRQLASSLRIEREQAFNDKILANMPVGIALIDPATEKFLQANSAFVRIVRSVGLLPADVHLRDVAFGEAPIVSREALAKVLRFGVPFQSAEHRTLAANGEARYLTTNLLRLQDSQQRTLGALCLVEDNTAAVTLRQEMIDANAAKDQFLAQLSHELRNPLSPVITMVAELETMVDAFPAAREPLEIIRRNVGLEARLIDDLLDVTRISSGKLQLNRETTDLHHTVRLALEICQRDIAEKGLTVEVDLRAERHWVQADPARLQQIFWNLLKNAVKFTPAGRQIAIRSANPAGAAQAVTVEVVDDGIGIDAKNLGRIFNAFDQGQSSITRRFGGLGLGLAISKAMVDAHGGTIDAESEGIGAGATFTVRLETCAEPAPAPARVEPTPAIAPGEGAHAAGSRVLLVDDHLDTCLGMERLLKRRGYQVETAHTVAQALTCAREEPFDLLISDIGLPDGTGFDLMDELRRHGGPPGIALSGFGMESDVDKSREAGFSEHLIKPVNIEQLDAAMRKLLSHQPVKVG